MICKASFSFEPSCNKFFSDQESCKWEKKAAVFSEVLFSVAKE